VRAKRTTWQATLLLQGKYASRAPQRFNVALLDQLPDSLVNTAKKAIRPAIANAGGLVTLPANGLSSDDLLKQV
jgi:hypothetical protein